MIGSEMSCQISENLRSLTLPKDAEHGELVGMDVAVEVDVGDSHAAGVACRRRSSVIMSSTCSARGWFSLEHAEVEVGAVAMIIDGEDFDAFAAGDQVARCG